MILLVNDSGKRLQVSWYAAEARSRIILNTCLIIDLFKTYFHRSLYTDCVKGTENCCMYMVSLVCEANYLSYKRDTVRESLREKKKYRSEFNVNASFLSALGELFVLRFVNFFGHNYCQLNFFIQKRSAWPRKALLFLKILLDKNSWK